MTSQLSMATFQNNCVVFLTSNFTNMYADTSESVKGFSNWNLLSKLTKVVYDYNSDNEEYKKIKSVVLKTLEGIETQLQVKPGVCPLYFFMVDGGYHQGAVQVPYSCILLRIKTSLTFKEDEEIQKTVEKIIQIYNNHPMGSDQYCNNESDRTLFKNHLCYEIEQDLKMRYRPKTTISIRDLEESLSLVESCIIKKSIPQVLPPANPLDQASMMHYLQQKVIEVAKLPIFCQSSLLSS